MHTRSPPLSLSLFSFARRRTFAFFVYAVVNVFGRCSLYLELQR